MQRSPFRAVLRLKSVTNSKINLNSATFHFFQKGFDAKQPFKFLTLNNLFFKKICSGCSDHFGKKQRKLFTAEVGTAAKSLVPSSANRSLTVLQAYRKNFVKTKFTVRLQKQIKYCFTGNLYVSGANRINFSRKVIKLMNTIYYFFNTKKYNTKNNMKVHILSSKTFVDQM